MKKERRKAEGKDRKGNKDVAWQRRQGEGWKEGRKK